MKNIQKATSILLSAAMVGTVLAGCGSSPASSTASSAAGAAGDASSAAADTGESGGYKGELTLMHYSTSEESEGNGGSDGFRTMISNWETANPDITLNQTVLANDDYKPQIATLAAADDLPDVFLLQGMNTKAWAEQGLIMDMTDTIKESPYYNDYNQSMFTPFVNEDKTYALPALTGGTCTVVVYDKAAWKAAGFDAFPTTWEEVKTANDYFKANGYKETIGFGNGAKWQINSCFLSTIGDRFTGSDWFKSLIEKGGAKFTDADFVSALQFTQDIFNSGIFNEDFNAIGNEDAREYYISGETPSLICGNWDVSYLQANLKEADAEKYENMGYAVLPQPEGATKGTNSQNIGLGYGIAINAKLKDDPEKLAAAIDFAEYVTGPEFSTYVGENYALQGLTKVADIDLSKFDQNVVDFYNYSYIDSTPCEIYDSYINSAVWEVLNTDAQSMLNGEMTPEEVAADAQASYEANY